MKRFYYIDNEGHKVAIQNYLVTSEAITNVELRLETKASQADLRIHTVNQDNPHNVTKAQVGLEYADNTSDLDKPISTATQSALDLKEDASNKVTTLSNSSTNTQYPSARVVYDELGLKENTSNKVTSLSYFSTDTQYPSAKAVYDQLSGIDEEVSGKENLINKVTSLSSNSTDTEYPSAKAVYDEIDAINTNITDNIEVDLAGKEDADNKTTTLTAASTDTEYPSAKVVYDTVADTERVIVLAEQHLATTLTNHTNNIYNPHNVTKAQVGLGNVDNTSDANKPISNATKTYIDSKLSILDSILSYIHDEYIDIKDIIILENGEDKNNIVRATYSLISSGSVDVVGDSGIYTNTRLYIDKVKNTTTPTTYSFATAGMHDFFLIKDEAWTELIADSFKNCSTLTAVYIPETITTLSDTTFEGCTGLVSVNVKNLSSILNLEWSDNISATSVRNIISTWDIGAAIKFSSTAKTRLTSELNLNELNASWDGDYLRCEKEVKCYSNSDFYLTPIPTNVTSWDISDTTYASLLDDNGNKYLQTVNFTYNGTSTIPYNTTKVTATLSNGNKYIWNVKIYPKQVILADGNNYLNTESFVAESVTYTRTYAAKYVGNYQCFYIPFDTIVTNELLEGFIFYTLEYIRSTDTNNNNTWEADTDTFNVVFNPLTAESTLHANVPYVIKPLAESTLTITSENVTVHSAENSILNLSDQNNLLEGTITGIYETTDINGYYTLSAAGNLSKYTKTTNLGGYRWYMNLTPVS